MVNLPYLPRVASGLLERALAASPVVVLMGARQTGKSTLAQSEPFLEDRLYLTLDDLEVDFVIEAGDRLLPIEVRAAANPGYADTRGLRAFRDEYPELFAGGLLLHGGDRTQWMSDGLLAAPWWRVL